MSQSQAVESPEMECQTSLQDDLVSIDTTSLDSQQNTEKPESVSLSQQGSIKKASHRASERKRRERLSASLTSLETIIRSSKKFSSRKGLKLNKNLLIEYTIDYIKDLEEHLSQSASKVNFLTQQLNTYQDNQTKLLQSLLKAQTKQTYVPASVPSYDGATPASPSSKSDVSSTTYSSGVLPHSMNATPAPVYMSINDPKVAYAQRKVPIILNSNVPYMDPNSTYVKRENYNPLFTSQYPSQQPSYIYPPVPHQVDGTSMNMMVSKPLTVGARNVHNATVNPSSSLSCQPFIQTNGYIEPVISTAV